MTPLAPLKLESEKILSKGTCLQHEGIFRCSLILWSISFQEIRKQLQYLKSYLFTCKQSVADEFRKRVWPKEYLFEHIHLYSLAVSICLSIFISIHWLWVSVWAYSSLFIGCEYLFEHIHLYSLAVSIWAYSSLFIGCEYMFGQRWLNTYPKKGKCCPGLY
jgi:hypothetical protein